MDKVHSLLLEYYQGPYRTDEIIADLAIDCPELLVRCQWGQKVLDCADIFQKQKAWIGICCLFNYNRPNITEEGVILESYKPLYVNMPGIGSGLTVVVNDSFAKFTYKIYSSVGTKLAIFEPEIFPEAISTGFSQSQAMIGREYQIGIDPLIVTGKPTLRTFKPMVRKCYFKDENRKNMQGYYSLSECIMRCNIVDVISFCGCIPPNYTNRNNDPYCMLTDLPCLVRWQERMMAREALNLMGKDAGQFTQCPNCLPRCSYINYRLTTSWSVLKKPGKNSVYQYGLMQNLSNVNATVIHFYFANYYVNTMIQNVIYGWAEVLALLGGICGFMYGASLLSIVELLYFVTGKFFSLWRKTGLIWVENAQNNRKMEGYEAELYWKEFYVPKLKKTKDETN